MRPRSISIYTKPPCQPEDSNPDSAPVSTSRSKRAYSTDEYLKMFEDFGPIEETHLKDAFSGDFQCCAFDTNDSCCSTTDETFSPPMTLSQLSSKTVSEDVFGEPKVNKIFRGMVIGSKESGKHTLVNAMFPSFEHEGEEVRQGFDLMTRKIETEESVERYHFWLKEAGAEKSRFESVMSVYYKTCSAFLLIYDIHDRTSFECLEKEIQLIQEANTDKEVQLVLIGNKRSQDKLIQVTSEEARCFKEKFNVQRCLELEISFEALDELKEVIQELAN